MTNKIIIYLLVSFSLVVFWLVGYNIFEENDFFWLYRNNSLDKTISQENEYIINTCKEEVISQLKSPWSAQFWEWIKVNQISMKNYVDSQNWFWALLRSKFVCTISEWKAIIIFSNDDPEINQFYKSAAWE